MTTGYLTLQKEISYKKAFLRMVRIFVPLLIISAYFYLRNNGGNGNILSFIAQSVANPQNASLWYLYMLFGLYLVIPFISKMVSNASKRDLAVFVLLFLIAPAAIQLLVKSMQHSVSSFWFSSFFPISVCYLVAGVYLSKLPLKRSLFILSVVLFLASEIPVIMSTINTYKTTGQIVYAYDAWTLLPVIVSSISFFYIIRFLLEKVNPEKRTSKVIREISATTFGVYIIHIIAINMLFGLPIVQSVFQLNSFVGLLVFQIAVFVLCSGVIFLLRKVPFIKWFL